MRTWHSLFPIRPPVEEFPDFTEAPTELRAHQLTVLMDDGGGRGLRLAKSAYLDGRELLLDDGASVNVEVSNKGLMIATLRVVAEVEFVEEYDSEAGAP